MRRDIPGDNSGLRSIGHQQHNGMCRDRFPAADRIAPFVGAGLNVDWDSRIRQHLAQGGDHGGVLRFYFPALGEQRDVDISQSPAQFFFICVDGFFKYPPVGARPPALMHRTTPPTPRPAPFKTPPLFKTTFFISLPSRAQEKLPAGCCPGGGRLWMVWGFSPPPLLRKRGKRRKIPPRRSRSGGI